MKKFAKTALGVMVACCCSAAIAALPDKQDAPPNIIVILVDDLALPDVSAYGYDLAKTPNIDRLAKQGTLFKNGYVAASVSAVSRAALMTGRYPQKFGFTYNLDAKRDHDKGLQLSQKTLPERLKKIGYNTNAIGKWHLGSLDDYYPTNRGFDDFYGFLAGETLYVAKDTPGIVTTHSSFDSKKPLSFEKRQDGGVILKGKKREKVNNDHVYITDDFTDKAVEYIGNQRQEKKPFFMYLAYNAPHWPLQVPEKYYNALSNIEDPVRRTYVAMINNLDDNIGRVLNQLEDTGQDKNTIVVFLSDNGCPIQFGSCDCSSPLGSGKFTYAQGGINMPFIVKWPDHIPEGYVSNLPVTSLDVVPTLLAGYDDSFNANEYDGQDLRAMLKDEETFKNRKLFFGQEPVYSMIQGDYKLWKSDSLNKTELFNLADDHSELEDISAQYPNIVISMEKDLNEWKKMLSEPDWPVHHINDEWPICSKTTQSVY
ncbi:TPA: sulfatase-like hydrolase/transferase [Salmonella enterica subsp. enterica serovar Infantis]|nr:sulfatase-like hydrolase/transferase [Salmonella enterica subsp. enterica serovar Infantis]HCD0612568.1 sulfatase-like hydrolase/transferase [Salmonella enterica subsp. enterica serovar Infantis]